MHRAVALCYLLVFVAAAPMAGQDLDPSRLKWSKARLVAKKWPFSLASDIEVRRVSEIDARSELIDASGRNALMPTNPWRFGIETKLLRVRSKVGLWLNAADGAALQRNELKTGRGKKKDRLRTYRYTDEGVLKVTQRPGDAGYDHPETWARTDEYFYQFPEVSTARVAVTEPAALFYLLSASDLTKTGDRLHANLFTKGKLVRLTIAVEGLATVDVDYVERSARGERKVKQETEALEVSLSGRPVAAGSGALDFKFLGLSGEKRVYLSRELRIPVLLTGKIRGAGKGRIQLKEVTLR